jgi:integration host factor subunit alpha
MAGKTITRVDLTEAVYQAVGRSRAESAELVEEFLEDICESLAAGRSVKLSGFGSFVVRAKCERVGRNPKTGIEVPIEQRRVVLFKPSNVLKAHVNSEATECEE